MLEERCARREVDRDVERAAGLSGISAWHGSSAWRRLGFCGATCAIAHIVRIMFLYIEKRFFAVPNGSSVI
jgi:hypothetical protein